MGENLYKRKDYLSLFANSAKKTKRRNALINLADTCEIKAIAEIVDNILKGNIPLTREQVAKLKKHKKHLRQIAKRKVATKTKKKLLKQTGGFLSTLIPVALSMLASLIPTFIPQRK